MVVQVATVLTVYGIETANDQGKKNNEWLIQLQQYLPFTVLKLQMSGEIKSLWILSVATVLTVYGIETVIFASKQI